ncbi:hypothetical protein [Helicobacter japonicus]|uniref:hypothetical protein n=1 Tax=Helicobacter japonicus TaxID=425400 RepID=UPI0025A5CC30|nr:hypothetical protein [Helicobacter japonicus]
MTNKQQVQRLRDCAELAMAAYGYFHLETSEKNPTFINVKDNKEQEIQKEISLTDILDMTYKDYKVYIPSRLPTLKPDKVGTLNGDFTPTQAKNFFERYDLLEHQPNTNSGFSATLFKDTKADSKDSEYILAIRGTEPSNNGDIKANARVVALGHIPQEQYEDMIRFYYQCAKKYPAITQPKSLNVVGHSLGGCLAQIFALSFAKGSNKDSKPKDPNASTTESNQDSIINEVYTFNSPGAKNLKPPYDMLISIPKVTNDIIKESLFEFYKKAIKNKAKELKINGFGLEAQIEFQLKEILNNHTGNIASTHFGISFFTRSSKEMDYAYVNYEKIPDNLLQPYQTLIHNYNNRNKKGYKLGISDKVFHIESKNQADKYHHAKESYKENAAQHLGKDIEGNYFILNLNFGGLDSHKISSMAKTLYFYAYLYEVNESLIDTTSKEVKIEYELHQDEFLKEHNEIDTQEYREHKKALEYCNRISLAINTILRNIEFQKALATSSSDDVYIPKTPNWLYAIIEQRVFEATIKTQQNKFLIKEDTSDIIEAILYLQQNKVYIQILEEDTIKNITPDSPLSQLFAIQESSFFISTDENTNPLIKDTHTANRLIGYRTPRAKIFCGHHKADTILVNCYKDVTLKHYPKAINE